MRPPASPLVASLLVTSLCAIPLLTASPSMAQEASFGGQSGPDLSIAATEPDGAAVDIGLAGEEPADIARYLLASGAGAAQLSPDGQMIAFSWSITGQPELWMLPASGGQPAQLTFNTGPGFFRWTPDGSGILYAADRDGNEQPGYFWISADGREERAILPASAGDFRVFGDFVGENAFVYSSTLRNGTDFDIYRADFEGNSQLIYEGRLGTYLRSVSPDGRYGVVTESVGEDADNLYLLDLDSRELRMVSAPPVEDRASHSDGGFEWLADSSGFFHASNARREWAGLTFYDVASGDSTLLAEPEWDVSDISLCGVDQQYITYTRNENGFDTLHMWRLADQGMVQRVAGHPMLPEGRYGIDCQGDTVLMSVNGWRGPGELFVFSPGDMQASRVFTSNMAGLDRETLIRPQVVNYPARDGVELQGLLYLPPAPESGPEAGPDAGPDAATETGTGGDAPPVVFFVHGGPSAQATAGWNPVIQYHVARGVAVFAPNVRGSTGLGRTYSTLDDRENRLDSVRDLVDLLAALDADGLVDGERAAVLGGSYGGYMVNAVLSEYPEAFAAGVSLFGVGNWITALEVASPALKASDRIEYGDISEERWRDFYAAISPVFRADAIRVPVLYSHGAMDPRIDIAETEIMVTALRENGVRADFLRLPDEGHGWRKLANRLFYHRAEAAFLEEALGLTAPAE